MTKEQISMRRSGLSIAILGLLFSLCSLPFAHPAGWLFLQLTYWPFSEVPADLVVPNGVLIAISSGLTVGIGAMLWAIGTHVTPVAPQAGRKVVQISAWSWFVTDSTFSVLTGAPMNAALNIGFLALMLLPLWTAKQVEKSFGTELNSDPVQH